MNKIENKIGISLGVVIAILFLLMSFGSDIKSLNNGNVFTPTGLGEGVFNNMADFITYNVFIVGCVLAVIYVFILIGKKSDK